MSRVDVHLELRVLEGGTTALLGFAFGVALTFRGALGGGSSSLALHAYNLKINLLEVQKKTQDHQSQKLRQNQIKIFLCDAILGNLTIPLGDCKGI